MSRIDQISGMAVGAVGVCVVSMPRTVETWSGQGIRPCDSENGSNTEENGLCWMAL
jgi:DNA-binding protein H-NS